MTISRWKSECGTYAAELEDSEILELAHGARSEVGSCLRGHYSADGSTAVISGSAPMPPDSRSKATSFVRGAEGLAAFFASLWPTEYYVGEWHVHPGGSAEPSRMDDLTMLAIAGDKSSNCDNCLLLIVSTARGEPTEQSLHVYSADGGKVRLLREQP